MLYDTVPVYDLWEVKAYVPFEALEVLEERFEDVEAKLIRLMEEGEFQGLWEFQFFTSQEPNLLELKRVFSEVYEIFQSGGTEPTIAFVPKKDWLKENLLTFKPISFDKYYIYGNHITEELPKDKITLCIDASTAFGSGEHQTTQGCLEALSFLDKKFKSVLDLGCGSGILAMAYAKTYQGGVDAVDIDPESVRVAQENVINNHVEDFVRVWVSNGFNQVENTYDLIFANILLRPLQEMAKDFSKHVSVGGYAILSGFLKTQEEDLLKTYIDVGFEKIKSFPHEEWQAVILRKK